MQMRFLIIWALCLCTWAGAQAQDYPYYDKNWKDTIPDNAAQPIPQVITQQESRPASRLDEAGTIRGSLNIGLGMMNSSAINEYIAQDLVNQGISLTSGSADMNSTLFIGGDISYAIKPRLRAKLIVDYVLGISSIEIVGGFQSQSDYVNYVATRLSLGAGANYYLGQRRVTPYLGGAILYHNLSFEEFKGSTIGPRVEGGAAFNFSQKFKMEAFFQADIAEAEATKLTQTMTLDLSTISIGARFLFRFN